ncbi:MAG TPA: SDR family NAD(P)-dependent oxidoreductase [Hyphomonas sp.]|nr:SDR family NAD(P)-dependent oxidoreductase [Hyphomonas sp.]
MSVRFEGQVAVITGAGGALGQAYARELAKRGARLVLNDLGTTLSGATAATNPLDALVDELAGKGTEVVACRDDLADAGSAGRIVEAAMDAYGRVDVLINNAGIMRNGAFKNMSDEDFRAVFDVHVFGAARLTREVLRVMIPQAYGRILMTTSAGGLYGAFGVANYGAAKLAQVGLMNVLAVEGARHNILVNTIAPVARSRMLDGLVSPDDEARLTTDWIVPAAAYLVSPACEQSGEIMVCGGGHYASVKIAESRGVHLDPRHVPTLEDIAALHDRISSATNLMTVRDVHAAIQKTLNRV